MASNAWMPAPGRYPVSIGTSLNRALKARKLKGEPAATTTKRSNLPERDFHSIRYNFKPNSTDSTKPASLEVKRGAENSSVTAEIPSTTVGEAHVFLGAENPATEVDCVLIFDEEKGTYTLEKMDSFLNLRYDRKTAVAARSPQSASPSPPLASLPKKSQPSKSNSRVDGDFERQLLGEDDGADRIKESVRHASKKHASQEEEEDEEILALAEPAPPPKRQAAPPPPKPRPTKPLPKPRGEAKTAPSPPTPPLASTSSAPIKKVVTAKHAKPSFAASLVPTPPKPQPPQPVSLPPAPTVAPSKPRPVPAKGKKSKRESNVPSSRLLENADEEIIEFGKSPKRARPSPPVQPPPQPVSLSLPGGSNAFAPPPPPPQAAARGHAGSLYRGAQPVVSAPAHSAPPSPEVIPDESDEDEEWETVATTEHNSQVVPSGAAGLTRPATPPGFNLLLEEVDPSSNPFDGLDGEAEGSAYDIEGDDMFGSGDEGQDQDLELDLEQQLNMDMEEMEDDFLTKAMVPDQEPVSLNRFAGGGVDESMAGISDDEYSSSDDESDDD